MYEFELHDRNMKAAELIYGSISTSATTTSISSLSRNVTPMQPKFSYSYIKSSRCSLNTSKNSKKRVYETTL